MESNAIESMKTPKRSRRLSSKEFDQTSQGKRSIRKTITLEEIEETNNVPAVDSITPSRSTKLINTETPSRSDALTPRRSVRKSVKPVQEYENIVAQKGLSSKRALISSLEDGEEEAAEGKWIKSVIGRVSAKRGKKARRAKKKQLQRQENVLEAESDNRNKSNDDNEEMRLPLQSEIDDEKNIDQDHSGKEEVDDITKDEAKKSAQVGEDKKMGGDHLEEDMHTSENEKQSCSNEDHNGDLEPLENSTCKDKICNDDNEKEMAIEEDKILQSEINSTEVHKDENVLETLDTSTESGDIEMETMPITADDCMESIKKPLSSPNKFTNAPSTVDFINKDDDSDCIMISLNDSSNTDHADSESEIQNSAENNMPTLLVCSDDEEDLEEVFVNNSGSEEIENAAAVAIAEKEKDALLNCTFDTDSTIDAETPKLRPSMTRVQTPFKSAKAIIPDIIIDFHEELNVGDIPELLVEQREGELKSSRKRSFSFCVDRPKKCVTFHSPANTTVAIFDGDLMKTLQEDGKNITGRRKRSLSVTETDREVVAYFKQRKPFESTPSKKLKLPEPSSRSKMPNFAAIHQQQFQRMESIADHVARRVERAKVLSNSVTKVKPTIIQKGMPIKNAVLRDCNQSSSGHNKVMSKARQRIELSGIDHKPSAEANNSVYSGLKHRSIARPDLSEFQDFSLKLSSKMSSSCFAFTGNTKHRLPKPKFDATLNTLKADIKVAPKSTANTATASVSHALLPDTRPRFNTSTAIDRQPPKGGEKLEDRRKRYLDMYKSRSSARTVDKKSEILKGVRTNRRFELQMMCRNRPK